MTNRQPESGRLEQPVFARGDPEQAPRWSPPAKPSPWARHFEVGRAHPRQWLLVSVAKGGGSARRGPKATRDIIEHDRRTIEAWLKRHVPLERWQLRTVTVAGTHCDRELYMRFLTTLTEEEHLEDLARRRASWLATQAKIIENRERRAREAREQAAGEEAAARIRGSRRGRN